MMLATNIVYITTLCTYITIFGCSCIINIGLYHREYTSVYCSYTLASLQSLPVWSFLVDSKANQV